MSIIITLATVAIVSLLAGLAIQLVEPANIEEDTAYDLEDNWAEIEASLLEIVPEKVTIKGNRGYAVWRINGKRYARAISSIATNAYKRGSIPALVCEARVQFCTLNYKRQCV